LTDSLRARTLGIVVRMAVRVLGIATRPFFGARVVVAIVPAGPRASTPSNMVDRVQLNRSFARTRLGPFELGDPRLAVATCTADGRVTVLTYESPITSERTTLTIAPDSDGGESVSRAPGAESRVGATDPSWCVRVAPMFAVPSGPPS